MTGNRRGKRERPLRPGPLLRRAMPDRMLVGDCPRLRQSCRRCRIGCLKRNLVLSARGCSMSARRRKRKLSGGSNAPAAAPRKRAVPTSPRPPLSRRRKWLFRLAVMILAPVLFFTLLEAGLRLGGYGYPTAFFVGPDADGVYTTNLQFGWRFFPRSLPARRSRASFRPSRPARSAFSFSGVPRHKAYRIRRSALAGSWK